MSNIPQNTFMARLYFAVALSLLLMGNAFAQAKLTVDLKVNRLPQDGLVFRQISIGSLKDVLKDKDISDFAVSFHAKGKSFDAQLIPDPSFGVNNFNAMVLISAPGQQQLAGTLELTPVSHSEKSAIKDSYIVSTSTSQWKFSPQQTSIFPSQLTVVATGNTYTDYVWGDRVFDPTLGGFDVAKDKHATLTVLSDGPIATVIRGKAQYVNPSQASAPGNPQATYDWYFFKQSPLVYVDARQSTSSAQTWKELHFMEWNFHQKYFSNYLNQQKPEALPLTSSKQAVRSDGWAALLADHDAIAYFGGKSTMYDGVNDYGNYIRSDVSQNWDGTAIRSTAWLWTGDFHSSAQLSEELNKVSSTENARFAQSDIEVAAPVLSIANSQTLSSQDQRWMQSAMQREVSLGKISVTPSQKVKIPATWQISKSGDLGMILDVRNDGVHLISLYDLKQQKELSADQSAPLFDVTLLDPAQSKSTSLKATSDWESVSFQKTNDGFQLVFHQNETVHPLIVTVTAVAVTSDSAWSWAIDINNKDSKFSVHDVRFPQIELRQFGDHTADFIPVTSGQVIDRPFENNLSYTSNYPSGATATMQFMAAYQESDNPTGLYVARHDPTASLKTLQLQTDSMAVTQSLSFSQLAENPNTPGNTFHFEGTAVWKLLHGNWFDAASYYRDWVSHHAKWWPEMNDDGRVDTPLWYKKLNVWSIRGQNPTSAVEAIKKMKDFIGLPMADHWYNWHQNPFDNDYPHYFPAVPGFQEAVNTLQQNGDIHVMPYINGRLWDTRDKGLVDFEFTKKALPWATKILDGTKLVPFTSSFHSKESDGSKVVLAVMCPYTPFWQNTVTGIVKKLTDEVGVDGVYIDQIGASVPVPCMDPSHGHPLGGGHWWVDGYDKMLQQIQQNIPANRIITTEDNAEPYMKYLDGMLGWIWLKNGQVPAYSVVYGSAVQVFGRENNRAKPNISMRMKSAQELTFGEQIGWISPDAFFSKDVSDETRNYFKQLVHVRNRINSYIYAGQMLRPPLFTGNNPPITSDWGRNNIVTTPSVLTASWKKYGANKIAFVFTNTSEQSLQLKYHFDPSEYGVPSNDYVINQWESSKPDDVKVIHATVNNFDLSIPGLNSVVWEVSWK